MMSNAVDRSGERTKIVSIGSSHLAATGDLDKSSLGGVVEVKA